MANLVQLVIVVARQSLLDRASGVGNAALTPFQNWVSSSKIPRFWICGVSVETNSWSRRLRLLREARGTKRADLAEACGVSHQSVYSYESGRRRPTRETLDGILRVLGARTREADIIRYELGFSTETPPPHLYLKRSDPQQYVHEVPWPEFVTSRTNRSMGANNTARYFMAWMNRFRGQGTRTDLPKPGLARAICASAFDPRLPYIVNLEEVLTNGISMWKWLHGPQLNELPDWIDECLDTIALIDKIKLSSGSLLATFLRLWEQTPPMTPGLKHYCREIIASQDLGQMEFWLQTVLVDEREGICTTEMIPGNAHTWNALNCIKHGNRHSSAN